MNYSTKQVSEMLRNLKSTLPAILLKKHFELNPDLKEKYGERQKKLYQEDTQYHLSYLTEAISASEPILFNEYLGWAKTFFASLPVTDEEIVENLELLKAELKNMLPSDAATITSSFINAGIHHYNNTPAVPDTFLLDSNKHKELALEYLENLIKGNKNSALQLIINAVKNGVSIKDLYLEVFQVTQKETGRLWQMSKISVAQEHFITAATQFIMSQLYPYLFNSSHKEKSIIVSCIAGELHELGVRMVADLFEMEGWNSYYFGANIPELSLIKAVEEYKPNVIAISATMTFNLGSVAELIEKVKNNTKLQDVKILVGGHPFTLAEKLWKNMGADGFAKDAVSAIEIADQLSN